MTVIRSIGNNPGRFGALCWTQTGRTGKACILCWCTRLAVWLLFSFFSLLFRWGHLVVVDSCEEIIVGYVVSLVISYHEIHPETKKKKKKNQYMCILLCSFESTTYPSSAGVTMTTYLLIKRGYHLFLRLSFFCLESSVLLEHCRSRNWGVLLI